MDDRWVRRMLGTESRGGAGRRLGAVPSRTRERRAEILAMAYAVAALGAMAAWAADPSQVLGIYGLGVPIVLATAVSVGFFMLRHRLPAHAEDVAVVASLVLLGVGVASTAQPLFAPYYVWVGFSAPLWFPLRRALLYLLLTVVACGAEMAYVGTSLALATFFVVTAVLVIAFVIVQWLSRALVDQERLGAVAEMASALGHELRNPLTAIANALYLVRSELGQSIDADVERHLAMAEREAKRAAIITEDLLLFVRHRSAMPAPVHLPEAVQAVLSSTPPPTGVRLELALGDLSVTADPDHLAEVLTNLVENAYQAMASGGTLRVTAMAERAAVRLDVTDTGEGMDAEVMARIFEPFFTTRGKGTGLGLAMVARLVEENGGTVEVVSAPGQGARFSVRLPPPGPVPNPATSGNGAESSLRSHHPGALTAP